MSFRSLRGVRVIRFLLAGGYSSRRVQVLLLSPLLELGRVLQCHRQGASPLPFVLGRPQPLYRRYRRGHGAPCVYRLSESVRRCPAARQAAAPPEGSRRLICRRPRIPFVTGKGKLIAAARTYTVYRGNKFEAAVLRGIFKSVSGFVCELAKVDLPYVELSPNMKMLAPEQKRRSFSAGNDNATNLRVAQIGFG